MRISDWSSDVCSSDLQQEQPLYVFRKAARHFGRARPFDGTLGVVAYARAGDGQAAAKGWKVERLARQPVDSAADEKILIEHRYGAIGGVRIADDLAQADRKSTRLNSSH